MATETAATLVGSIDEKQIFIPLLSSTIDTTIVDVTAQVRICQTYQNLETSPIHATFQFPLARNAAICGFEAQVENGVRVVGQIKAKQDAQKEYQEAVSQGKGAYMLEKSSDSSCWSMNIGNLAPQKKVTITLDYVEELDVDNEANGIVFTIPALQRAESSNNQTTVSNMNKMAATSVKFNLAAQMSSDITSVQVLDNNSLVQPMIQNTRATVQMQQHNAYWITKPLTIMFKTQNMHEPRVSLERNTNTKSVNALLTFNPDMGAMANEKVNTDCVFLLDRSGSMSGTPIQEARQTLIEALQLIPESCDFNVIGFGSSYEAMFPQSVEASSANISQAIHIVNKWDANLGGTNLFDALQFIYSTPISQHQTRQIFCISDGQVENASECTELVQKYSNSTRVFSFGIGSGVDRALMKSIARRGHGKSEFVASASIQQLKEIVVDQVQSALQPAFTHVQVSLQSGGKELPLDHAPSKLPPMFNRSRYVVYASIPEDVLNTNDSFVRVTGLAATGEKLSYELPIRHEMIRDGKLIHTLAAKQLISELEEGELKLTLGITQATAKATALALQYSIACNSASFVAVEQTPSVMNDGTFEERIVPTCQDEEEEEEDQQTQNQGGGGGCGGGGSGLGTFFKLASNLAIVKAVKQWFSPKAKQQDQLPGVSRTTPFGFEGIPVTEESKFSMMLNGPVADLEGKNCWLNALLFFFLSNATIVNHFTGKQWNHKLSPLASGLSVLLRVWKQEKHDSTEFRTAFDFANGLVWNELLAHGFRYGYDYTIEHALTAIVTILKQEQSWPSNVAFTTNYTGKEPEDAVIALGPLKRAATVQSFISHHYLAKSKHGYPIGHFSCTTLHKNGYSYYDDMLRYETAEQYHGGFAPSCSAPIDECAPAYLIVKSEANNALETIPSVSYKQDLQAIQKILSQDFTALPANTSFKYQSTNTSTFGLQEWNTLCRIRFACYAQESLRNPSTQATMIPATCMPKSADKLKLLAQQELKLILASPKPLYGMYQVCANGILQSLFHVPSNSTPVTLDWMTCLSSLAQSTSDATAMDRMNAFFAPCNKMHVTIKKRRAYKQVPLVEYWQKTCLLIGK